MLAHHLAVLAQHNPLGIGPYLHRAPHRARLHAVVVVVEAHQQRLRYPRPLDRMEAIERAAVRHQVCPLLLEHLPHRLVIHRRVPRPLRLADALLRQPSVELLVRAPARARHEQPTADRPHLFLDLTLLPPSPRRTRHRLDQVMRAHLQKPLVVPSLLADEHRVHRRLHVVVDAALADPAKEPKRPLVRIEHHLLALARVELETFAAGLWARRSAALADHRWSPRCAVAWAPRLLADAVRQELGDRSPDVEQTVPGSESPALRAL